MKKIQIILLLLFAMPLHAASEVNVEVSKKIVKKTRLQIYKDKCKKAWDNNSYYCQDLVWGFCVLSVAFSFLDLLHVDYLYKEKALKKLNKNPKKYLTQDELARAARGERVVVVVDGVRLKVKSRSAKFGWSNGQSKNYKETKKVEREKEALRKFNRIFGFNSSRLAS